MAIQKILDLSTNHAEQRDFEVDHQGSKAAYEEGMFLAIYPNMDLSMYSKSFKKVVSYALNRDCSFIVFDADAEIITSPALRVNEW